MAKTWDSNTSSWNDPMASAGGGGTATAIAAVGDKTIIVMSKDSALVSTTAPSEPTEGDLWFDSSDATLCIYYGTAWVGIN
jgi:hypothetical protein